MDDWLMQREASGQPALDSESESDGGDDGQDRPPAHVIPLLPPLRVSQVYARRKQT